MAILNQFNPFSSGGGGGVLEFPTEQNSISFDNPPSRTINVNTSSIDIFVVTLALDVTFENPVMITLMGMDNPNGARIHTIEYNGVTLLDSGAEDGVGQVIGEGSAIVANRRYFNPGLKMQGNLKIYLKKTASYHPNFIMVVQEIKV